MSAYVTLHYNGKEIPLSAEDTVLDGLLNAGVAMTYSCKSGICRSCLMRRTDGPVPFKTSGAADEAEAEDGVFLACQYMPDDDMTITETDQNDACFTASVAELYTLAPDIMRLQLTPEEPFFCTPGRYIKLQAPDGGLRCYSVSNRPETDGYIELHIKMMDGGAIGDWLRASAAVGDTVKFGRPEGRCTYKESDERDATLVMIAADTGLSPIYGIACDALRRGHTGNIILAHIADNPEGLYLQDSLHRLSEQHPNISYHTFVFAPSEHTTETITRDVMRLLPSNTYNVRCFLCGPKELIKKMRTAAFMSGLPSEAILADIFFNNKAEPVDG